MYKHVFLTGDKQIGKSTLIKKILNEFSGNIGGFYTQRSTEYLKDRYAVHIFKASQQQIPTAENFLFECRRSDPLDNERFDKIGCGILNEEKEFDIIIMDELGRREAKASNFRKKVFELLKKALLS